MEISAEIGSGRDEHGLACDVTLSLDVGDGTKPREIRAIILTEDRPLATKVITSSPANRIRRIRLAQGLSQIALAKKMGVDQAQISHWERGRHRMLGDTAMDLAIALGVSVADLNVTVHGIGTRP